MISSTLQNKCNPTLKEDTLTSSVFDLLKYLPADLFWSILKQSLYQDILPKHSGEIQSYQFWARWSTVNITEVSNAHFIEPDLFIQFSDFDIILEAKRYDENQQSTEQRTKQILTYFEEFSGELTGRKLYFIEVGGLHDKTSETITLKERDILIARTDWSSILNVVCTMKSQWDKIAHFSHQGASYVRIFNDLIALIERHGFFKQLWLCELLDYKNEHKFTYDANYDFLNIEKCEPIIKQLWLCELLDYNKKHEFSYDANYDFLNIKK